MTTLVYDRYWNDLANQIATQAGIPDSRLEGLTGVARYQAVLVLTSKAQPDQVRYETFIRQAAAGLE